MPTKEEAKYLAQKIQKEFIEKGKALEGGFMAFCLVYGLGEGPVRDLTRNAFFGGAETLFTSIMQMLDPGSEATAGDLTRIDKMWKEIDAWRKEMELRHAPPGARREPYSRKMEDLPRVQGDLYGQTQ